jgi:hypothetical protein
LVKGNEPLTVALKRGIKEELGIEVDLKGLCMTPFDFGYTVEEHGLPHIFACGHSSEI